MMKKLLLLMILISSMLIQAQEVYKFAVEFKDKDHTPYSIDHPEAFLSQRAIDRRAKYYIGYNESDLPIDPAYISDVLSATDDVQLIIQVKWINTIIISLDDPNHIASINALPEVKNTAMVYNPNLKTKFADKFKDEMNTDLSIKASNGTNSNDSAFYGGAWTQIHQLKGEKLHEQNLKGEGMVIAVLDAGFISADTAKVFDNLWDNGRLLGTSNMVEPGETVYANHGHGTFVLSIMGGYLPGEHVGVAPEASYWLIRTEDVYSENIIEEYNWVAGAAFADSVGADILNTSLGYIDFDDSNFDHTYDDLDGNTTIITKAANMASQKGMLVLNSAGNSGHLPWRYVGAPADGYDVFTIGSVNGNGVIAYSSSHGFPWSEDVKPDVVARGSGAYGYSVGSASIAQSSGTSFSCPVISGMSACLWSANPTLSPFWIKEAIVKSADKLFNPDTLYGYGMPDFQLALNILGLHEDVNAEKHIQLSPNPVKNTLFVGLQANHNTDVELLIYNLQGVLVKRQNINYNHSKIPLNISSLSSGMYILELRSDELSETIKFTKI